jgi:hypothetical protein
MLGFFCRVSRVEMVPQASAPVLVGYNMVDLTELDSFFKVMKKPLSASITRRTKSI